MLRAGVARAASGAQEGDVMGSVILYCRMCNQGYASVGELPALCPSCERPTRWSTMAAHTSGPPLPLSVDDRRFLRSLHIEP